MVPVLLLNSLTFGADWLELQRDPSREGYIQERVNVPVQQIHHISIGEEISGTLVIIDNDIYYATVHGTVGSVSLIDGTKHWSRNLNGTISSAISASHTEIFVVTEEGHAYCLSTKNGAILWTMSLGFNVKAPLMKYFRYLYILGEDGSVFCLNAFDGKVLWNSNILGTLLTSPSLKQNYLYIVTQEGRLFCVDAYNGRTRWVFEMDNTSRSSPMPSTEIILIADDDGEVYGVDFIKGTAYFKKSIKLPVTSPFSYGYFDRRMVIAGTENAYTAFGSANGNKMWAYSVDNAVVPPMGTGDRIWIPGKNNTLVALDSFTGGKIFETALDSTISAAMAVSNGRIVVGTQKGSIYVFSSQESDYTIDIQPPIGVVVPGQSFAFEVNVLTSENFNDTIMLTVGGFPCSCKGVGRYFEQSSINESGKVRLVIDTTDEATPERFRLTVSAYSQSGIKRSASSVLSIQDSKDQNILAFEQINNVKSGQDFTIDLMISKAANVRSIQSLVSFPTEHLFLHKIEAGTFYGERHDDFIFDQGRDNLKGIARIGLTKKDIGAPGSGSIARFHFRAKKTGTATISILLPSVRDTFLQEISYIKTNYDLTILPGIQKVIELRIAKPTILIDGAEWPLDAPPVIIQGRTLVPIRRIAEEMETTVSWDAHEQKVTLNRFDIEIELWIGRPTCKVNGIEKPLPSDVAPSIIQNRTFLPLRFVAEELGGSIEWFSDTQRILITYPSY